MSLLVGLALPAMAQTEDEFVKEFIDQPIETGLDKTFTRETSTQSVSVITGKTVDKRSAKNVGTSILGQGNGLISLENAGTAFNANPTFYVRGLQTLNQNTKPLILVDGIERDITVVSAEEVAEVQILKDASAVALYGYKGANGVVLITTKRGKYNTQNIRFNYDHVWNYQINRPSFVDGYTYANAMNQALIADGAQPRYDQQALDAFKSGAYPYQYPNVDWLGETFRNHGMGSKYAVEFSGGGEKFRYFTMVNLLSDNGFIKNPDETKGYSTQDEYVRGNLRVNLDIDLTPNTYLKVNMLGVLSEVRMPGNQADLWKMMYDVPSAAFPILNENGSWGGNSTWIGTNNPLGQSTDAAYYKLHERSLFADMTLKQNLSMVTEGLGFSLRLGYDTYGMLYEDHSHTYVYGMNTPVYGSWNADGTPVLNDFYSAGERTEMGTGAANTTYQRRLTANGAINYDRTFGDHAVYAQANYAYEFVNTTGNNTSIFRHTLGLFGHYAYQGKYILDASLSYMGSSRLAKGSKWAMSPTVSAAWVASKESFLEGADWLDLLKVRGSFGIINADFLPGMTYVDPTTGSWTYDVQSYSTPASNYYLVDATAAQEIIGNRTELGTMATINPTNEKAQMMNIGIDAAFLKGITLELDYYRNSRRDIFVAGSGAYSAMIGFEAPYKNAGRVDSHGFEAALDYNLNVGEVELNFGGRFNMNKNEIKEQGEEPRAFENLVTTGYPVESTWGYEALGLFQSQEEINNAPVQNLGSTPRVGDIRYKDVNGDGVIDANDKTKIGYSAYAPEMFYSFHLGAEWKGLGFDAMFQGVGNYTANLTTEGYYWGLINNSNLSQYVYENSWTPEHTNAEFPRLSSSSNANNYQTSTLWQRDRSYLKLRNIELYYNFSEAMLAKTKVIKALKVYARGTDLFSFDNFEEGADAASYGQNVPLNKSVILGASITF